MQREREKSVQLGWRAGGKIRTPGEPWHHAAPVASRVPSSASTRTRARYLAPEPNGPTCRQKCSPRPRRSWRDLSWRPAPDAAMAGLLLW